MSHNPVPEGFERHTASHNIPKTIVTSLLELQQILHYPLTVELEINEGSVSDNAQASCFPGLS